MGTKLDHTVIINPLAARNSFVLNEWDRFGDRQVLRRIKHHRSGEDKFQDTMDKKLLEKHNLDSIKRTMQMHEDTFKHQVTELHRLYRVQKMLMSELKKQMEKSRVWSNPMAEANPKPQPNHHQTSQSACGYHVQGLRADDPMSSRERSTGSCSGDNMRTTRGFNLDRPAPEEDMSTGVSAVDEDQAGPSRNKGLDGNSDEDSEVELTLSIGGSSSGKKRSSAQRQEKEARELHSSASFKADRGGDCSDPTTPMSSSSASFDQERKRPHWLFQGLSLNSGS